MSVLNMLPAPAMINQPHKGFGDAVSVSNFLEWCAESFALVSNRTHVGFAKFCASISCSSHGARPANLCRASGVNPNRATTLFAFSPAHSLAVMLRAKTTASLWLSAYFANGCALVKCSMNRKAIRFGPGAQNNIVGHVVGFGFVLVMYDLSRKKWPSEDFAHYQAMLKNVSIFHRVRMIWLQYQHVTLSIDISSAGIIRRRLRVTFYESHPTIPASSVFLTSLERLAWNSAICAREYVFHADSMKRVF